MDYRRYRNISCRSILEATGLQTYMVCLLGLRFGRLHHSFGDVIRFPLVIVSRLADRRFPLYRSCCGAVNGNLAEIVPWTS